MGFHKNVLKKIKKIEKEIDEIYEKFFEEIDKATKKILEDEKWTE